MTITKIEKTGKKCRLYLNDAPAFCLYPSEIRKLGLTEGGELSDEALARIYGEILDQRAKKRSLLILKSADRTERQLREKLHGDGYPEAVIDSALDYVKSYGYIDDLRYACNYIDSVGGARSRRRIAADLTGKGIASDTIEMAFEQAQAVDEGAQILRLAQKRRYDPETATGEEKQKLIRYLMGRGYGYDQIKKALT